MDATMRTYCLVAFWMISAAIFVRTCYIVAGDYPRKRTVDTGAEEIVYLLFEVGFFVWLGQILWSWF